MTGTLLILPDSKRTSMCEYLIRRKRGLLFHPLFSSSLLTGSQFSYSSFLPSPLFLTFSSFSLISSIPFVSTSHSEDKRVSARSDREVNDFRAEKQISTQGQGIPKPVTTFDEAGFPDYILAEIKKMGFTEPSAIQAQAWPMALNGRDLV